MMPHCGPPRSLSPEKSTRSAPAAMPSAAVGSSATPGGRPGARAPEPMSSIIPEPMVVGQAQPGAASSGSSVNPTIRKLLRWTRRMAAVSRADRALVVGQPRLVGRADFAEPGARDLEDLGKPEAAADLDELAARDDHLAAGRQAPSGPGASRRRCC